MWELGRSDHRLSFSELMGGVGVEDTGTFGFHLKALGPIIRQEKDGRYALSPLGMLAYELVCMASSSDLGSGEEAEGRPRPRVIFEVQVEGDESKEPIGVGVRSSIGNKEQKMKVISFMIGKLKEMEEANLDLVGELKICSSTDGKHTEFSEDWKTGDRRKWREYVITRLQSEMSR